MANYCRFCGSPLSPGAKFCQACGNRLTAAPPDSQKPTSPSREMNPRQNTSASPQPRSNSEWAAQDTQRFRDHNTGQQIAGNTQQFRDRSAGQAQPGTTGQRAAQASQQFRDRNARQAQLRSAGRRAGEGAGKVVISPQLREMAASVSAGEFEAGIFTTGGMAGAAEPVVKVLSPISGIFHGIGDYLGGIFRIFRKPSALIGTVIMAGIWFALAYFRDSNSEIVKVLSWLTYSEGGFDRGLMDGAGAMGTLGGVLGTFGGILGKGTVAAALISLFSGDLRNLVKGIGALFAGHGERRGIFSVLIGIVLGAAAYFAFVGTKNASADTAMAGIAGALLSLEALGGGSGKLYALAQSLTSRAANGVRTAVRGKCDGLLTGLTLGFALATALSAAGVLEGLL